MNEKLMKKQKKPSGPPQISFAAHQAHIDKFHNCACGSCCTTSIDLTVQDPKWERANKTNN